MLPFFLPTKFKVDWQAILPEDLRQEAAIVWPVLSQFLDRQWEYSVAHAAVEAQRTANSGALDDDDNGGDGDGDVGGAAGMGLRGLFGTGSRTFGRSASNRDGGGERMKGKTTEMMAPAKILEKMEEEREKERRELALWVKQGPSTRPLLVSTLFSLALLQQLGMRWGEYQVGGEAVQGVPKGGGGERLLTGLRSTDMSPKSRRGGK